MFPAAVNIRRGKSWNTFQAGLDVFVDKIVFLCQYAFISICCLKHHPGDRFVPLAAGFDYRPIHSVRVVSYLIQLV